MKKEPDEIVILLHGLMRSPLSMLMEARAIKRAGFAVANWGYMTLIGDLDEQIARLESNLSKLQGYKKVHGAGHSLGGLMLRGLFSRHPELPLGRLVLQGTPNHGAAIIERNRWLFGHGPLDQPIIHDLAPHSPALQKLGVPPMEIGVIAGVEKFHPFNPASWINERVLGEVEHDGTVEVESTKLEGMQDFLEVPVNHSFLPLDKDVIDATIRFLKTGSFKT